MSILEVVFALPPRCRKAQTDDLEGLRKVYGFTDQCYRQKAKHLWNAAEESFYEHLAKSRPLGKSDAS